jgi:lycopene beta-cyclase
VPGASRDIRLAQHFVGWVIETDRPHFDPGEATLMDFIPDSSGVHFRYILPFGPRRALVEDTWFSPEPWPRHVYEALLAAELERSLEGDEYRVVHTEAGVIPMTTTHLAPHPSPRRYRLGLAGGAAKPSSGYAFGFIQRDAASLAGRLAHFSADSTPPPLPAGRPVRAQALDNLFLSYLAEHPESAPEMFFQLFARADTDSLARFLSETSSPRDDLAIIWALPPWPMIAHLLRRPSRFRPRPSAA